MRVTYHAPPTTQEVRDVMVAEEWLGAITTPDQRNAVPAGVSWVADNGLGPGRGTFTAAGSEVDRGELRGGKGTRTDPAWWEWLASRPWPRETCRFAVAPDVPGDADQTLARSAPWLPKIRDLGIPAALVAQDGLEDRPVPWSTFDVLFVGGTTAWKLGQTGRVRDLVREAHDRGKGIHVGRVNSLRRLRYAASLVGDDVSVDGTFLAFAPSTNLARMRRWVDQLRGPVDVFL